MAAPLCGLRCMCSKDTPAADVRCMPTELLMFLLLAAAVCERDGAVGALL